LFITLASTLNALPISASAGAETLTSKGLIVTRVIIMPESEAS